MNTKEQIGKVLSREGKEITPKQQFDNEIKYILAKKLTVAIETLEKLLELSALNGSISTWATVMETLETLETIK